MCPVGVLLKSLIGFHNLYLSPVNACTVKDTDGWCESFQYDGCGKQDMWGGGGGGGWAIY